jgi:hypothetical protein
MDALSNTSGINVPKMEYVGELTIIWEQEKLELHRRIAQLELDVKSLANHLWHGHAVENQSRLDILETALSFWSNESMHSHLELINSLTARIKSLEEYPTPRSPRVR